jgi:arylsulfatase A-like enzyme/lysophospholipase L1-like esterase
MYFLASSRAFLAAAVVACLSGLWGGACAAVAAPNVVILYADDLGYGDVHCYNPDRGRIPTPHIDRLAADGIRFTDAHASSGVCSPSRYTLLTGRYHWRSRLQKGIVGAWEPPLIGADRVTIGRLARQHGYRTACIGKWHLGWDWPFEGDERSFVTGFGGAGRVHPGKDAVASVSDAHREAWQRLFSRPIGGGPTTRGFDSYFGTDVPNWPPYCFIENDRTVGIPTELLPAADFRDHRASTQGPALAGWRLEDVLPALRDRAVRFIEESSRGKAPFLLYLPLTSPHTPLAVNEPWQGKSGLDNACADLVMETDAVVGDVLAALDTAGIAAETIVLFSSDNGFAPYVGAAELEARGHYPSGPFRGYKSDAWEGGHRVPFIVRWPGVVKPGSVCDQLVHQADLMATLADVLGAKLPDDAGEDSVSLVPLLRGGDEPVREHAVSCAMSGVPAVRLGSWKYIAGPGSGGWSKGGDDGQPVQLYDLAADHGETNNLAVKEPQRVARMQELLEQLIADGRSTPGKPQRNDVEVVRSPKPVQRVAAGKPAKQDEAPAPGRPARRATSRPEAGSQAETDGGLVWQFTPDPALPNVLILGDSISIGYTLPVRKLLTGKANVFRPMAADGKRPANCGGTTAGVRSIDSWLAGRRWDVIHFNWGLHDLKHVKRAGSSDNSDDPSDPVQADVATYAANLRAIVVKLEATGARLVFATTTPVQPGTTKPLREPESPGLYNAAATAIMRERGIRVNDLFSFCLPRLESLQLPKNVHFTPAGSEALADEVTRVIAEELGKK